MSVLCCSDCKALVLLWGQNCGSTVTLRLLTFRPVTKFRSLQVKHLFYFKTCFLVKVRIMLRLMLGYSASFYCFAFVYMILGFFKIFRRKQVFYQLSHTPICYVKVRWTKSYKAPKQDSFTQVCIGK